MNPSKGEVRVVLSDGVERTWRLTGNDICGIQSIMEVRKDKKITFIQFISQFVEWGADDYRLVLWTGLKHADSSLTEDKVGELMDLESMLQFQSDFAAWTSRMIPESMKKKAAAEAPN